MLEKQENEASKIEKILSVQNEITMIARAILIDWMICVCQDMYMTRDTLHYAVRYIDFLLEKYPKIKKKEEFQTLGLVCLIVAAKMEEKKATPLTKYIQVTDYSSLDAVIRYEVLVTQVNPIILVLENSLEFETSDPNPVA